MNNPNQPAMSPAALNLRAFVAYCESGENPSNPFTLLPFDEACNAGIPFSQTFIHEGLQWAVFVTGDFSPCDVEALEQAGIIDDEDDARMERHERDARKPFDYAANVAALEARIPADVAAVYDALSLPSICAAETVEDAAEALRKRAEKDGSAPALRIILSALLSALPQE